MQPLRAARPAPVRTTAVGALSLAVIGGVLGASPSTASLSTGTPTSDRLVFRAGPIAGASVSQTLATAGETITGETTAGGTTTGGTTTGGTITGGTVTGGTVTGGTTTPVLHEQAVPTVPAAQRLAAGTDAAVPSRDVVAELPAQTGASFETVGVTWDHATAPADVVVQVRVRRGGDWTGWEDLHYVSDEGPAAGEEAYVRDGTEPWWTGPADGVAVRATSASGKAPQGISVVTIDDPTVSADPTESTASARSASTDAATAAAPSTARTFSTAAGDPITGSPAFPKMPSIVSRRQWGADESLGDQCFEPIYGETAKMVFIHHTVGDNDYTQAESPAIVRSIYAYHTQGQGWCDIGYNFLVDRFGTVYQGRAGGVRLPVRGAHAGDYNVDTVGISMMGNFDLRAPSDRMKNAVVRLVGWRLGTSYRAPHSHTRIEGTRFSRISGHRDAMSTACPGRYAYAWLPTLRDRVGAYLENFDSPLEPKADALGVARTGPIYVGEVNLDHGRRAVFDNGELLGRRATGAHWLSGAALSRYRALGGPGSALGLPVSDFAASSQPGVRTMAFDQGRMYVLADGTAKALWGRIQLRWHKLGGFGGRLGGPRTSVLSRSYGFKAGFQGGVIRYDTSANSVTVTYR